MSDAPKCPKCGYVERDAWEIGGGGEGDFEHDCGHCDHTYLVSRHISVWYTSKEKALYIHRGEGKV